MTFAVGHLQFKDPGKIDHAWVAQSASVWLLADLCHGIELADSVRPAAWRVAGVIW